MEANNPKQNRRRSHIKNLYLVAIADGNLDYIEEMFLFARGASLNIKKEEVRIIMQNPDSIPFLAPNKFANKILQMYDLVHMMLLNGTIDDRELSVCKQIAQNLNIEPELVNGILKDIYKRKTNKDLGLLSLNQISKSISNN